MFAYQTAVHHITAFSLFDMLFGRKPTDSLDLGDSPLFGEKFSTTYIRDLKRTIENVHTQARAKQKKANDTMEAY